MPKIARLSGINPAVTKMKKEGEKLVRAGGTAMSNAARAALRSYYKGTPVWSGETVRNYKVALGASRPGYSAPVGGRAVMGTDSARDPSLQNEQRRPANEQASYAEANGRLKALATARKLMNVIVFNAIPANKAALVEAGVAPTPEKSRYPGGLTPRAKQAADAALKKAKNPK